MSAFFMCVSYNLIKLQKIQSVVDNERGKNITPACFRSVHYSIATAGCDDGIRLGPTLIPTPRAQ